MTELDPSHFVAAVAIAPIGVILNGPSDWHEWLYEVQDAATKANIWTLIDPSSSTVPVDPIEPEFPPIPEDPTDIQHKVWTMKKSEYDTRHRQYINQTNRLREIDTVIKASINPNYRIYTQDKELKTVYSRLKALQDNIAPDDRAREHFITAQYEALKKTQKR